VTETKEIVTTRIYSVKDMTALLGEGKQNVRIYVSIPRQEGRTGWTWTSIGDTEILKVEIREPYEKK